MMDDTCGPINNHEPINNIAEGSIAVARILSAHNISLDHLRSVVSPKMDAMRLQCMKVLLDHGWGRSEAERYCYEQQ